jgi:hypothetical protein
MHASVPWNIWNLPVPSPTLIPAFSNRRTSQRPLLSEVFELGQCEMDVPRAASSSSSSSWRYTPWASTVWNIPIQHNFAWHYFWIPNETWHGTVNSHKLSRNGLLCLWEVSPCHIHQHNCCSHGTMLSQLQLHLGSLRCESITIQYRNQVSMLQPTSYIRSDTICSLIHLMIISTYFWPFCHLQGCFFHFLRQQKVVTAVTVKSAIFWMWRCLV